MSNLPFGEPRVVWYIEDGQRYDAEVIRYHSSTLIDVDIIQYGAIRRKTSVPLVAHGVAYSGDYAERPDPTAPEGLPDLDKVQNAKKPPDPAPEPEPKEEP